MPKCSIAPPSPLSGDTRRDLQALHEWGTALTRDISFLFDSLESEFEPMAKNERRNIIVNSDQTDTEPSET